MKIDNHPRRHIHMTSIVFFALVTVAAVVWLGVLVVSGFSLLAVALGLLGVLALTSEAR
jgi:hypothetical protein